MHTAKLQNKFDNAVMQLREQYLKNEPMHDRSETYAAINKSIKSLNDPFTRLLEPSRYQALKRGNQGSVIGVGLEVGFGEGSDSQLVVNTFPNLHTCFMCKSHHAIHGAKSAHSRQFFQRHLHSPC